MVSNQSPSKECESKPYNKLIAPAYPCAEAGGALLELKRKGGSRYCKKCQRHKPPRTHHCRVCNKCVLRMDHHCVWAGEGGGAWSMIHAHVPVVSLDSKRGARPRLTYTRVLLLWFGVCNDVSTAEVKANLFTRGVLRREDKDEDDPPARRSTTV